MKDETKSFVKTTRVVAEIHHHHQQLTESSDIKDVINELENACTKKLKEMTLVTADVPIIKTPGDHDLSPDLIVESSEGADDKSLWEDDGWSSSVDEIEEDCSDLTSYRTDSNSSGESSDARSPAPGPLSPSSTHHRRRSVSLADECCGVVEESVGGAVHNCDGGCNAFNMGMRGGGCGGYVGHGHGHGVDGSRGSGPCDAPKMCSSSMGCTSHGSYVRYDRPSQVPYNRNPKTAGLNFNTNLRKPPENWLRMRAAAGGSGHSGWGRHGTAYWSYPYSKQSSWSMFAYRYIGRGRRPFHKGLANNLVCLCCGCCNCSRVNQTCCCCCYHCVHRISSCRRPDLTKINRPLGAGPMEPGGPRKSVSNSLQQQVGGSEGEASGSGQCGQGGNGQGGGEQESGLESGMDSGTESTSGKTSERSKKKSSSGGSGKSSTTTPSNETMPKLYKM